MPSVRVISYNVLSSELSGPDEFPHIAANDRDPSVRLQRLLAKLGDQIDDRRRRPIIALQEVSPAWHNALDVMFAARGYELHTCVYKPEVGLGVALAIPRDEYIIVSVDQMPFDIRYPNRILAAQLMRRDGTGMPLTVATVHTPCEYQDPELMDSLTAAISLHCVEAKVDLICGDFNIRPSSNAYRIMSAQWSSAMLSFFGHEPPFTCLAPHAPRDDFALDYIWTRQAPTSVQAVHMIDAALTAIPNATEPSDHVMIGATVQF